MGCSVVRILSVCSLALFCTVSSVSAATTIYTDRAAFDLATGGSLSFDDLSDASFNGFSVQSDAGFIQGGQRLRDRPTPGVNGASTTFTFNSPITAFGGDYDLSPGGAGTGLRFVLDGNEIIPQEISGTYSGFWGFVSDTFFTSVEVRAGSGSGIAETHTFDNFSFGVAATVAPIPVPASLPLLLTALLSVLGWRRWQQGKAVSLA